MRHSRSLWRSVRAAPEPVRYRVWVRRGSSAKRTGGHANTGGRAKERVRNWPASGVSSTTRYRRAVQPTRHRPEPANAAALKVMDDQRGDLPTLLVGSRAASRRPRPTWTCGRITASAMAMSRVTSSLDMAIIGSPTWKGTGGIVNNTRTTRGRESSACSNDRLYARPQRSARRARVAPGIGTRQSQLWVSASPPARILLGRAQGPRPVRAPEPQSMAATIASPSVGRPIMVAGLRDPHQPAKGAEVALLRS